jgi:hypothetical protein
MWFDGSSWEYANWASGIVIGELDGNLFVNYRFSHIVKICQLSLDWYWYNAKSSLA